MGISFIPPMRRHLVEDLRCKCGARENIWKKEKWEAASVTELSEEESQIEEKVKSRRQASWRN
jgi:hypothetical protein